MAGLQVVAGLLAAATCSPTPTGAAWGATLAVPQVGIWTTPGARCLPGFPTLLGNRSFAYNTAPRQITLTAVTGSPLGMPVIYQRVPPASAGGYQNPAARYVQDLRALLAEPEAKEEAKGPLQEVVITGSAPIGNGDRQTARQAAIQQALRNALEKVVGVYVSSATVAEKYLTLQDRIYTRSEGFVVPGDVLEETVEQGTVTVRMRASVSLRPLLGRLKELGLTRAWKVAVAIREGDGTTAPGAAPLAEAEITRRLLGAGFQVVYLTGGKASEAETYLQALHNENGAPLADLLIVGNASARLAARMPVTLGNTTISVTPVYLGRVDARAIRVETGEVVATHVVDEAAADRTDSMAAGIAVQASARRIAGIFLDDLTTIPASFTRRVKLEVSGFQKRTRAQALEDTLLLLPGVRQVRRQEFTNGCLALELEVDSEAAERLGTDLESASLLREYGLTVESDTKARVSARVSQ